MKNVLSLLTRLVIPFTLLARDFPKIIIVMNKNFLKSIILILIVAFPLMSFSQSINYKGRIIGKIESNGDVYIDGSMVGKFESDGDVYRHGSRVGEIESDGDVYYKGSRVGEIESDGDVYRHGSRVGKIESDGYVYYKGSRVGKGDGIKREWLAGFFFFFFWEHTIN